MSTFTLLFLVVLFSYTDAETEQLRRAKRAAVVSRTVDLTDLYGTFSSPGYTEGENYPLNIDLTWILHVPRDSAYNVTFDISYMDIEAEPNCNWDYVAFGENFEERLCGNRPGVYTVQNVMGQTKFRFFSDFYLAKKGFTVSYSIERLYNPCDESFCLNNSTCKRLSDTDYKCICTEYYTGGHCQDFVRKPCKEYPCLIFEDNFDYLNHKVWEHEITLGGGGNWEFQHYTNNRTNSYCKEGVLYIKPTLTAEGDTNFLEHGELDVWGMGPHETCTGNQFYGCKRVGNPNDVLNPIQSARLRSSRGFNLRYGKVEVEAKIPIGDWLWPAIWMMPTWNVYGGWPASGEIDIMESRGNLNYTTADGQPVGADYVGSTLHFGPNYQNNGYMKTLAHKVLNNGKTFADEFHRYSVEWNRRFIRFRLDDDIISTIAPGEDGFWKFGGFDTTGIQSPWRFASRMAPFDQEFYIILNLAVGGMNYFSDDFKGPRPKPWTGADKTAFWRAKDQWYPTWNPEVDNGEGAALKVNHVKVWKMEPDPWFNE